MVRSTTAEWRFAFLLMLAAVIGCSGVAEDRAMEVSVNGDRVAFQHGDEGVFVASNDGASLEKVFATDDKSLTVSTPLWSPTDDRMIFTSARSASEESGVANADQPRWDDHPEGRPFFPGAIVYTCWLQADPKSEDTAPPVALFEARCNHPGYVAANLAVRWHPSGEKVLYIDQVGEHELSLFEFDMATQESNRILDESAAAIIFDWSPSGTHLAYVLYGHDPHDLTTGIWIRPADESAAWKIAGSEQLAEFSPVNVLESLRLAKPVWTDDDQRFAFIAPAQRADDTSRREHSYPQTLHVVDVAMRDVKPIYTSAGGMRDVRWRPGTAELGFIVEPNSTLQHVDAEGKLRENNTVANVRSFVGWNRDGQRAAYVVPEEISRENHWAFLFSPIDCARDRVVVAPADNLAAGKEAFADLRITFPRWMPESNALSLWATFGPTHRSWLSLFLPMALRPGDPAAILDLDTGAMQWMAVSPHEEAQIGHYHLLQKNYDTAWKWYSQSAERREPLAPVKLSDLNVFVHRQQIHYDATFFEFICLLKLNRPDEATERLALFRRNTTFEVALPAENDDRTPEQIAAQQAELERLVQFITPLMQNAFITEAYLSLDAANDGIDFFRRELEQAEPGIERLSAALCLSQLLLIIDERAGYADLAADVLIPALIEVFDGDEFVSFSQAADHQTATRRMIEQLTCYAAGGAALLPLMSADFLATFDDETLRMHALRWTTLRESTGDAVEQFALDLMLHAAYSELNAGEQLATVNDRLAQSRRDHPALTVDATKIGEYIANFRREGN